MAKRILLADDSITIQKVVELTFSDGDYEVVAVNNGSKAIQKLSEMRPDIILSDIIMPEKNGYEVCEFVKSHPEFRTIPVILLTGTFEPFDPDRADKAGCDAVVTKPFESQSLIHKVEELIGQAKSQGPATAAPAAPAPPTESPFAAPPADEFATGAFQPQGSDIFGAPSSTPSPTTEMPFDTGGALGGETRAMPRMSFEELQKIAKEGAPPAPAGPETRAFPAQTAPEPSPWDEQPLGGRGEMPAAPPANPAASPEPASPWDQAPAATGGETRAFPRMSFEEMRQMAQESAPSAPPLPEPSTTPFESTPPPPPPAETAAPWDEQPAAAGGETRALPRMSFEEMRQMANEPAAAPKEAPPPAAAPPPAPTTAATPGDLTDEQVDRIARRVVQLMSEQVVRNIAWEVIPELAETVVKERIRQLESES